MASLIAGTQKIINELYTLIGECKRRQGNLKEAAERALVKLCDYRDKKEFLSRTQHAALSHGGIEFPVLEVLAVAQAAVITRNNRFCISSLNCMQRMLAIDVVGNSNIANAQDVHIFVRVLEDITKHADESMLLKVVQTILLLLAPGTKLILQERTFVEVMFRLLAEIYTSCPPNSAISHTALAGLRQGASALMDAMIEAADEQDEVDSKTKTISSVVSDESDQSGKVAKNASVLSIASSPISSSDVNKTLALFVDDLCAMCGEAVGRSFGSLKWLNNVKFEITVCLDLYQTCFAAAPRIFVKDPSLVASMKQMCEIVLIILKSSKTTEFPIFVRAFRLFRTFLLSAFVPLLDEMELLLIQLLEILNSSEVLWQRAIAAELVRLICDDPQLLKCVFFCFGEDTTNTEPIQYSEPEKEAIEEVTLGEALSDSASEENFLMDDKQSDEALMDSEEDEDYTAHSTKELDTADPITQEDYSKSHSTAVDATTPTDGGTETENTVIATIEDPPKPPLKQSSTSMEKTPKDEQKKHTLHYSQIGEVLSRIIQETCFNESMDSVELNPRFASFTADGATSQQSRLMDSLNELAPPPVTLQFLATIVAESIIAWVTSTFVLFIKEMGELDIELVTKCLYGSSSQGGHLELGSLFECLKGKLPSTFETSDYLLLPLCRMHTVLKGVICSTWAPLISSISLFMSLTFRETTWSVLLMGIRVVLFMGCLLRLDVVREACLQAIIRFAIPLDISSDQLANIKGGNLKDFVINTRSFSVSLNIDIPLLSIPSSLATSTTTLSDTASSSFHNTSQSPMAVPTTPILFSTGGSSSTPSAESLMVYRRVDSRCLYCLKSLCNLVICDFGHIFGKACWLIALRACEELEYILCGQYSMIWMDAEYYKHHPSPGPLSLSNFMNYYEFENQAVNRPRKINKSMVFELSQLHHSLRKIYDAVKYYSDENLFDFVSAVCEHLNRLQLKAEEIIQQKQYTLLDPFYPSDTQLNDTPLDASQNKDIPLIETPYSGDTVFTINILINTLLQNLPRLTLIWPKIASALLNIIDCYAFPIPIRTNIVDLYFQVAVIGCKHYQHDTSVKTSIVICITDFLISPIVEMRHAGMRGLLNLVKTVGEGLGGELWSLVIALIGLSTQSEFGKDFRLVVDSIENLTLSQNGEDVSIIKNYNAVDGNSTSHVQAIGDTAFSWLRQLSAPITISSSKDELGSSVKQSNLSNLDTSSSLLTVTVTSNGNIKSLETLLSLIEVVMEDFAEYMPLTHIWKILLSSISLFAHCHNLGNNVSLKAINFLWTLADILGKHVKESVENHEEMNEDIHLSEEEGDENEDGMIAEDVVQQGGIRIVEKKRVLEPESLGTNKENAEDSIWLRISKDLSSRDWHLGEAFEVTPKVFSIANTALSLTKRGGLFAAPIDRDSLWIYIFLHLRYLSLDVRPEVRNSALLSLHGALITHGGSFGLHCWRRCVVHILMATLLDVHTDYKLASHAATTGFENIRIIDPSLIIHHSRDSLAKQWDETLVIAMDGVYRVLVEYGTSVNVADLCPCVFALLQLVDSVLNDEYSSVEVLVAAARILCDTMRLPDVFEEVTVCSLQRLTGVAASTLVSRRDKSSQSLLQTVSTWKTAWSILWCFTLRLLKATKLPEKLIEVLSSGISELYASHGDYFTISEILIVILICSTILTSPSVFPYGNKPAGTGKPTDSYWFSSTTFPSERYYGLKLQLIYPTAFDYEVLRAISLIYHQRDVCFSLPVCIPKNPNDSMLFLIPSIPYPQESPPALYAAPYACNVSELFDQYVASLPLSDQSILSELRTFPKILWNTQFRLPSEALPNRSGSNAVVAPALSSMVHAHFTSYSIAANESENTQTFSVNPQEYAQVMQSKIDAFVTALPPSKWEEKRRHPNALIQQSTDIGFAFSCVHKLTHIQEIVLDVLQSLRLHQKPFLISLYCQLVGEIFLDTPGVFYDGYRITLAIAAIHLYVKQIRRMIYDVASESLESQPSVAPTETTTPTVASNTLKLPYHEAHPFSVLLETIPSILHQLVIVSRSRYDPQLRVIGVWKVAVEAIYYIIRYTMSLFNFGEFQEVVTKKYWISVAVTLFYVTERDALTSRVVSEKHSGPEAQDDILAWQYFATLLLQLTRDCFDKHKTYPFIYPILSSVMDNFGAFRSDLSQIVKTAFVHMVEICQSPPLPSNVALPEKEVSIESIIVFPKLLNRCRSILDDYIKLKKKHRILQHTAPIVYMLTHLGQLSISPALLKYTEENVGKHTAIAVAGDKFHILLLLPKLIACIDSKDSPIRLGVQTVLAQLAEKFGSYDALLTD